MHEELENSIFSFLQGYRSGTQGSYGSFLYDFIPHLLSETAADNISDISVTDIKSIFSSYCKAHSYKTSSVRNRAYALCSYLEFLGIALPIYQISDTSWTPQSIVITDSQFDSFIQTIYDTYEDKEITSELVLISSLAFHTGLTLNEILKLHHSSFQFYDNQYHILVEAVSRKDKVREVTAPLQMNASIQAVLSREKYPLFGLGKDGDTNFVAQKRRLQRMIKAVSDRMDPVLRCDLKAFRTARIYTDIYRGSGSKESRKFVMDTYGVSKYYVSRILCDPEEKERY